MEIKTIRVTYKEPAAEEIADRESRTITFADGSKGIIQNERDENGAYILVPHGLVIMVIPKEPIEIKWEITRKIVGQIHRENYQRRKED